ncbi:probable xyloglucan galactosyltransferase GT17 [Haliotis rufescens]|uniref:probable xyloglucan galactosyltransferase GT17 n=1 Tax=Haliotis rufescens TaxID=6454 RepID=UPI00201EF853|nr:probable xyloglucan galactosyltransferase GT17 [Haliotis rufescens]XP_046375218.2 probable xyloglucan galactosyltransferase GT17 [Haliotis rufescens]
MFLSRRTKKRLLLVALVAIGCGVIYISLEEIEITRSKENIISSFRLKGNVVSMMTRKPKVFIYPLPPKFNKDVAMCVGTERVPHFCFHLENGGMGTLLYREGEMGVFHTSQFSLEVILHNQLLQSQYRTMNPEEADIFYIPAYLGMFRFCNSSESVTQLQDEMFKIIHSMPYLKQGKPHISSLARIEREQAEKEYPLLMNPNCKSVTYIVIEKESLSEYRKVLGLENQRVIVAPYPSYVHQYNSNSASQAISSPGLGARQVLIFVAASVKNNEFRRSVLDQMSHKVTGVSFERVIHLLNEHGDELPGGVFLNTIECQTGHENITIGWMQKSVFCLQPPGDSPTRKSFYDSIQSGCIPVIFRFADQNVEYPFQRVLNYTDFTVTIDSGRIEVRQELIRDILNAIPQDEVKRLHQNVLKVARMLQYSAIDSNASDQPRAHKDALDMIIQEVQHMYNI